MRMFHDKRVQERSARRARFCAALLAALTATPVAAAERDSIAIAVLDFDYSDSSGELRDQAAEHRARLSDLSKRLRDALGARAAYRLVPLDCSEPPCTAGGMEPEELFQRARAAGARLVLYGGVHKMSTLVQWAQVELVDVEANRLIDDRRLSFRGDSDEAWRRAAEFIAAKLTALDCSLAKQP